MSAGIGSDSNQNILGGCHESSGIAYSKRMVPGSGFQGSAPPLATEKPV
jgi:hypothetical protein